MKSIKSIRERRHKRVRAKIKGTKDRPRISVFRSAKHIYAQLIDDGEGNTLATASDFEIKTIKSRKKASSKEEKPLSPKAALAFKVGELLAKKALDRKINKAVFDKSHYKYHGRVKALAEGARAAGLEF